MPGKRSVTASGNRGADAFMTRRLLVLAVLFCGFCGLLLVRLWFVQAFQGSEHTEEVARQSIRRIRLTPVRGRIFARNGEVLVDNVPEYELDFHVSEMRQPGPRSVTEQYIFDLSVALAKKIGRLPPLEMADIKRHLDVYPALALTVFTDLLPREQAILAEMLPPIPNIELRSSFSRYYPFPWVASHMLGFAGRRPPEDAERRFSYRRPELQGRAGLELAFNQELAGIPGMRMVRVNTLGYVHEQIGEALPPVDGADLVLTLDLCAQRIAERLMNDSKGAFVLLDAQSGAVLAMVSSPSYDLSTLSSGKYAALARDEVGRPLFNRALGGGYLPGSIVKPIIGMAALEAGVITEDGPEVVCTGRYRLGDTSIGCWLRSGHGPLTLEGALAQSCNSYFIEVGQRTGLDNIAPMMRAAGLGETPAIELPGADAGLVPSREWALRYWGRPWIAIDTAFLSIGQGAVGISPLQAAVYAAAIGNGGSVFRPYTVQELRNPDGTSRERTAPVVNHRLPVSRRHLARIREGMYRVVNGEHATAAQARNPALSVAGKTGTAEVKRPGEEYNNAWFIGYAPVDTPRYAVAVVIERGSSGGRSAAPIVGAFFTEWLAAKPQAADGSQ
jgi:penicillin-binding protein 2